MNQREVRDSTFVAHEENGNAHTVYIWNVVTDVQSRAGTTTEVVSRRLRLSDGSHVNKVAKGEYRIGVFQETRITSNDPNAI
jgi:hypothetical protein